MDLSTQRLNFSSVVLASFAINSSLVTSFRQARYVGVNTTCPTTCTSQTGKTILVPLTVHV